MSQVSPKSILKTNRALRLSVRVEGRLLTGWSRAADGVSSRRRLARLARVFPPPELVCGRPAPRYCRRSGALPPSQCGVSGLPRSAAAGPAAPRRGPPDGRVGRRRRVPVKCARRLRRGRRTASVLGVQADAPVGVGFKCPSRVLGRREFRNCNVAGFEWKFGVVFVCVCFVVFGGFFFLYFKYKHF